MGCGAMPQHARTNAGISRGARSNGGARLGWLSERRSPPLSPMWHLVRPKCGVSPGQRVTSVRTPSPKWPALPASPYMAFLFGLEGALLSPQQRLGLITLLFKGGGKPRDQAASYRPITLMNCDVKILAKVVVLRAAPVLDSVVDSTQTAFGTWNTLAEHCGGAHLVVQAVNVSKQEGSIAARHALGVGGSAARASLSRGRRAARPSARAAEAQRRQRRGGRSCTSPLGLPRAQWRAARGASGDGQGAAQRSAASR
uniref:Uncharacterized protein n=1 Tax=Tetradesmus obliquus TaxID=3088 RepID=A0A383VIX3_TETOB